MKFNIMSIGHKMPNWVATAFQEYQKRFSPPFTAHLIEIPSKIRNPSTPIAKIIEEEGEKILSLLPKQSFTIALDEKGTLWNTQELADNIKGWEVDFRNINFLIGGPDGLSKTCLQKADTCWSLSPLTFPHPMVRVILIEQLYRAISILNKHPYHRI